MLNDTDNTAGLLALILTGIVWCMFAGTLKSYENRPFTSKITRSFIFDLILALIVFCLAYLVMWCN